MIFPPLVEERSLQCPKIKEMKSRRGHHKTPSVHVLAVPFPTQGHITPLLRFTHQLAQNGITVSFVCYEDAIPRLCTSANDDSSRAQNLDFRFLTLPRLEPDHKKWQHVTSEVLAEMMFKEAFEPLMAMYTSDERAGIAVPTCIISDMFQPWTTVMTRFTYDFFIDSSEYSECVMILILKSRKVEDSKEASDIVSQLY
jgi:hypothetical protein